ncbi:ferredoxin [Kitasatospora griseola]|uniref:ferredoxin n=1 Tax=Kitasatospora griseola TaxID=2064 RepID=UPI0036DE865F
MTDTTRWRLEADHHSCAGTGICAGIAPDHFRVVDGRTVLSAEETRPDETLRDAVESCPMEALRILDADSGEVVAPS